MNAKQVFFTGVIALASATAFADDITIDKSPAASVRSRAEIKAEVSRALAAGEHFVVGEASYVMPVSARSNVARSDVKAELAAAQAAGLLQVGEFDASYAVATRLASTRSRNEVKAEFIAARDAGELPPNGEAYDAAVNPHHRTAGANNPLKALGNLAHRSRRADTATQ